MTLIGSLDKGNMYNIKATCLLVLVQSVEIVTTFNIPDQVKSFIQFNSQQDDCIIELYKGHPKKSVDKQVYNFRGK